MAETLDNQAEIKDGSLVRHRLSGQTMTVEHISDGHFQSKVAHCSWFDDNFELHFMEVALGSVTLLESGGTRPIEQAMTVKLRSGGPVMTVFMINHTSTAGLCGWYGTCETVRRRYFRKDALIEVERNTVQRSLKQEIRQ